MANFGNPTMNANVCPNRKQPWISRSFFFDLLPGIAGNV
jgi:hypothetical protein